MSQHDYVIANASGATVRADLNSLFQAMLSQNSGTSAPSATAAGMFWLDTTGGAPYTLKVRDAGNNHWLTVLSLTDPGSDGNVSVAAIEGTSVLSTGESGTAKFLRVDGDGSCSWQAPTGLGSLTHLEKATPSGSSLIRLGLSAYSEGTFDTYLITWSQMVPSSNASNLVGQITTSAGGSAITSGYTFSYFWQRYDGATDNYGSGGETDRIANLGESQSTTAGHGGRGHMYVFSSQSASFHTSFQTWTSNYHSSYGIAYMMSQVGVYNTANVNHDFVITPSAGTISGIINVYGIKDS